MLFESQPTYSLRGAKKRGPTTKPRRKILKIRVRMKEECMPRSFAIACSAGATIDDDAWVMKVKVDTVMTATYLRLFDQFLGLLGSSAPSQVT